MPTVTPLPVKPCARSRSAAPTEEETTLDDAVSWYSSFSSG